MLGPIDRVLALCGIGGYFLIRENVMPGGSKIEIIGPYNKPFNPYANFRIYFFNSRIEYHLKTPEGAVRPLEFR